MNIVSSPKDPILTRIWDAIKRLYRRASRIAFWPLRKINEIACLPKGLKTWIKFVITWAGHGSVVVGTTLLGSIWGPWGAWAGFLVGATFYNAKESFRTWPPTLADVDYFGDMEGPIIFGSFVLMKLLGF